MVIIKAPEVEHQLHYIVSCFVSAIVFEKHTDVKELKVFLFCWLESDKKIVYLHIHSNRWFLKRSMTFRKHILRFLIPFEIVLVESL